MRSYSLSHLGDAELLRALASAVARDRVSTATVLAHVAEVDARRLYLPAAYPSMFAYCVHELRMSEDAAYKRIRAARTARQFPAIFDAVADGRLHLSAVVMLTPYLTPENAEVLLESAENRTKPAIEALLASRFPQSETLPLVETLPATPTADGQTAPPENPGAAACQLAPGPVGMRSTVAPVAPKRFHLHLTFGEQMQEKLQHAQELLGHAVPTGDVARVLERGLDSLIKELERRKFAAARKPRRSGHPSRDPRHIPAHVKRAVWERDGGRCTFVSEAERRCESRTRLEFDHVEPVARGGRATVAGIRLRCRAHNQYAAECAFGAEFMRHRRDEARRRAEARRQEMEARRAEEARQLEAAARARAAVEEVIAPLRVLGFRADEARRAAAACGSILDAPLEERVRLALTTLSPPCRRVDAPA